MLSENACNNSSNTVLDDVGKLKAQKRDEVINWLGTCENTNLDVSKMSSMSCKKFYSTKLTKVNNKQTNVTKKHNKHGCSSYECEPSNNKENECDNEQNKLEPQSTNECEPQSTNELEPQSVIECEPQSTNEWLTSERDPLSATVQNERSTNERDPQSTNECEPQSANEHVPQSSNECKSQSTNERSINEREPLLINEHEPCSTDEKIIIEPRLNDEQNKQSSDECNKFYMWNETTELEDIQDILLDDAEFQNDLSYVLHIADAILNNNSCVIHTEFADIVTKDYVENSRTLQHDNVQQVVELQQQKYIREAGDMSLEIAQVTQQEHADNPFFAMQRQKQVFVQECESIAREDYNGHVGQQLEEQALPNYKQVEIQELENFLLQGHENVASQEHECIVQSNLANLLTREHSSTEDHEEVSIVNQGNIDMHSSHEITLLLQQVEILLDEYNFMANKDKQVQKNNIVRERESTGDDESEEFASALQVSMAVLFEECDVTAIQQREEVTLIVQEHNNVIEQEREDVAMLEYNDDNLQQHEDIIPQHIDDNLHQCEHATLRVQEQNEQEHEHEHEEVSSDGNDDNLQQSEVDVTMLELNDDNLQQHEDIIAQQIENNLHQCVYN